MPYFKNFPLMIYELNGNESVVKDILRRATFASEYRAYADLLTPYLISDGDTPQSLGMSFYGAATYHWVILLFNEIHNPYFEWPVSNVTLYKLCEEKYGADVMYTTKHFEIDGDVVGEIKEFKKGVAWTSPTFDGEAVAVSFVEFEERANDARRSINIMRPELLGEFVKQFEAALNV